jgi:hypothetical protein
VFSPLHYLWIEIGSATTFFETSTNAKRFFLNINFLIRSELKMKLILLVASCLLVSACDNIPGVLTVNTGQTLQLKDKSGNLVTFNSGNANVQMSKNKIVIQGTTSTGKSDKVELDASNLPGYQEVGEHQWTTATSGQPVNIDELTQNTANVSQEYNGWQSCSFSQEVAVPCPPPVVQPDPNKPDPSAPNKPAPTNSPGPFHPKPGTPPAHASFQVKKGRHVADQGCYATRVFQGHQAITFHFGSDSFEFQLIMTDPTSGTQLATFQGFSDTSGRVIDSATACSP